MSLEHNDYKIYYITIEEAVADIEQREFAAGCSFEDIWPSLEEKQKILETGELWELRWYPNTPVGFHECRAHSFDVLMEYVKEYV